MLALKCLQCLTPILPLSSSGARLKALLGAAALNRLLQTLIFGLPDRRWPPANDGARLKAPWVLPTGRWQPVTVDFSNATSMYWIHKFGRQGVPYY